MSTAITAPNGSLLRVEWDDGAQLWICSPADQPDRLVAVEDRFLEGALAEALDFDVAHDQLPAWLLMFADHVRAGVPR